MHCFFVHVSWKWNKKLLFHREGQTWLSLVVGHVCITFKMRGHDSIAVMSKYFKVIFPCSLRFYVNESTDRV